MEQARSSMRTWPLCLLMCFTVSCGAKGVSSTSQPAEEAEIDGEAVEPVQPSEETEASESPSEDPHNAAANGSGILPENPGAEDGDEPELLGSPGPGASQPYEPLDPDEVSELGFSAREAAEAFEGDYTGTLQLADGSEPTELVIRVEPTMAPLGKGPGYDFGDEVAVLALNETTHDVRFGANMWVDSADGKFDEELEVVVSATSLESVYVLVWVLLSDVQGSYQSKPPEGTTPSENGRLRFTINLVADGSTFGQLLDSNMSVPGDRGPVATWGSEE